METLDSFLPNVTTQDTRKRIQAHQDLVPYLSDPHSSLTCPEMDEFIGGLVGWVNCSNYKVRQILILGCLFWLTKSNKSNRDVHVIIFRMKFALSFLQQNKNNALSLFSKNGFFNMIFCFVHRIILLINFEDVSEWGWNDINKTVKMLMLFICIDCISLHINITLKMIALLSRLYCKYWVLNRMSSLAYIKSPDFIEIWI